MSQLPGTRQQQILDWLHQDQSLTIDELVERLGVSAMTVHRDLDQLERDGHVEKVHGGVLLAGRRTPRVTSTQECRLCSASVQERTAFVIQTAQGDQRQACCPHCGFLLLNDLDSVSSVLARDFIYGRMVNAIQATYLLESDIRLCCVPSVLCFASREDAQRVQRGFNGRIATFAESRDFLYQRHREG